MLRDVGRVLQMPYGQVDKLCKLVPQNPPSPVTLAQAIDDEPSCSRPSATPSRWCGAPSTSPEARRPLPPRLDPSRRHRDRRPAAARAGAALPRSEIGHAGHPVQHEMGRAGGLVKFDFLGLKTLTVLRPRSKLVRRRGIEIDLSRSRSTTQDLRPAGARRSGRRLPAGKPGHAAGAVDMRPDRFEDIIALVALYRPGPMANIPTYCARKHGEESRIHPSEARADPARDLRRHRLPGTGDADRAEPRRLSRSARPTCCAAPWARRSRPRWTRSASASSTARSSAASTGRRPMRSSTCWQVRRLRLQQEPRRGLRAGRLPDRLHEGELSGRVPRRVDDARHGQHRQARRIPRRGAAARHQGRAAFDQPFGRVFEVEGNTILYALAALKGVGAQAVERSSPARGDRPFARPRRFRRAHQPARHVNKRVLESLRRRRVRCVRAQPRACMLASTPCLRPAQRASRAPRMARANCSAAAPPARALASPVEPWLPAERLQREYDAIGFFLSGHPLDDYAALKRMRVQSWAEFSAR